MVDARSSSNIVTLSLETPLQLTDFKKKVENSVVCVVIYSTLLIYYPLISD